MTCVQVVFVLAPYQAWTVKANGACALVPVRQQISARGRNQQRRTAQEQHARQLRHAPLATESVRETAQAHGVLAAVTAKQPLLVFGRKQQRRTAQEQHARRLVHVLLAKAIAHRTSTVKGIGARVLQSARLRASVPLLKQSLKAAEGPHVVLPLVANLVRASAQQTP